MPVQPTTSSTQQQLNTELNKLPSVIYESWTLYYRHGVNPNCQKGFKLRGTIQEANVRAKKHCEIMNYRFVFVRPMMVDLDSEEKDHQIREGLI